MKLRLLLFAGLISAGTAAAQGFGPEYPLNVGIYAGIAPTTKLFTLSDYSSNEKSLPFQLGVIGHYTFSERFQVGLDVNMNTRWSAKDQTTLQGPDGKELGSVGVRYLYADRVWTTTARANFLVPVYDGMKNVRSNFYYGIAFGGIYTVNDGRNVWTQFDGRRSEEYRYISEYHMTAGAGYILGFQLGMEWYTRTHFGFSLEAAPRFAHINTVDNRGGSRNGPYNTFIFPFTAGIRYRFGGNNW
jgi:hypothetical protein